MAARMPIIATTIISSIRVKPSWRNRMLSSPWIDAPRKRNPATAGPPLALNNTSDQLQPLGMYLASTSEVQFQEPEELRVKITSLPTTLGLPFRVHLISWPSASPKAPSVLIVQRA